MNESLQPTPRTDHVTFVRQSGGLRGSESVVPAPFARQLERELQAERLLHKCNISLLCEKDAELAKLKDYRDPATRRVRNALVLYDWLFEKLFRSIYVGFEGVIISTARGPVYDISYPVDALVEMISLGTKPTSVHRGHWVNAHGENHGLNSQPGDTWVGGNVMEEERRKDVERHGTEGLGV